MATSNGQNDWVKDVERIFKKSVEANKQMVTDSAAAMKRLVSDQPKGADGNNFSQRMNDLFQLNLKYTERLIDLGLEWSNSMANLLSQQGTTPRAEPAQTAERTVPPPPPPPPAERHQISMTGHPGETIANILQMQSSRPGTQYGRFEATSFVHADTGSPAHIGLAFDPQQFEIPPGQVVPATISVMLPAALEPATYLCEVIVDGFEDTAFVLVVHAKKPETNSSTATPKKAAVNKTSATKKAKT